VPDDEAGTGEVPPVGCSFISPENVFMIIDGLPPGTTIEADPLQHNLVCFTTSCEMSDGFESGDTTEWPSSVS